MKRFLVLALLLAGFAQPAYAVDAVGAQTVSACGTPNNTPVTGNPYAITMDPQGRVCENSSATTTPLAVTSTNISGTITSGGAFQSIAAASGARKGCLVQNPTNATEPLYVFYGANASATQAKSVSLNPGGSANCSTGSGGVLTDNVSVMAATTGHAFMAQTQ